MSTIKVGQLCESLGQTAEEKITGEPIQELIEKKTKLGWPRLFRKIIKQARKIAESIDDAPHRKAEALMSIAQALVEAKDLEQARKIAESIDNAYWKVEALVKIAAISHETKDLEQARENVKFIDGAYWKVEALVRIAEALAKKINTQ